MMLITINRLMRKQWARVNIFLATLLFAWTVDANTAIRLIEYQRFAQAAKEAQAKPVYVDRETGFPSLMQLDAVMWRGMETLVFGRFYRPGLPASGLGPNWRLNCDEQFLVAADGSARAELTASTEVFRQVKPGEWQTVKGMLSTVTRTADGQYVWTLSTGTSRIFARDGWLVKSTSPNGGFVVERDANGRALAVADLSGNRVRLTVAGGAYREMIDPLGSVWKYELDRGGRLVKVERPAGGVESYGYRENGLLETADQGFGKIRLAYDDHGRVISQKVGDRELETRRYAEGEGRWEMTAAVAGTDSFTYRRLGGGRTQEYQTTGQDKIVMRLDDRQVPVSVLDGMREIFSGKTDAQGHLLQYQFGKQVYSLEYSPAGQLTKITDGLYRETIECRYDDGGRLIEEKVGDRALNRIQWTTTGQCASIVIKAKDQPERIASYDYDGKGRLRSLTSSGETTEFQTDALGRIVQVRSSADTVTMAYNAESQMVAAVRRNGERIDMGYDQRGLPTSLQQGRQKLGLGYDEAGNMSSMTGAAGDVTKFGYDVFDRLCKVETPAGTFATEYDAQGRVSTQQMPGGAVERFFYDQEGRLSRAIRGGGTAIEFSYGADGKVSQLRGGKLGDVQFQYGREGVLAGWKDSRGEQIEIRDDAVVFKNSEVVGADVTRRVVAGKGGSEIVIESKCLPQPVRKILDAKGKVTAIESPAGRFEFTYDAAGRRSTMKYPNGVIASFTYNGRSQPLETKIAGKEGAVLEQWTQAYDEVGRCVRVDTAAGLFRQFTYDDAGRLVLVADGKGVELERYEYDVAGNRTVATLAGKKQTVVRDAQNRLVSQGDVRYAYDAQGRRIGQTAADGRQWRYDYDGLDRLVKAATPGGTVQYGYSLLGARLWSQKEGGEKRYSLYAGLDKVAEVDAGGRLLAGYVPGLIADEVLASCDKQGNWTYNHCDPLLNLRLVTDAKGASQFRPECTSFGEPINAATAKQGANRLFAGTEYDADTGLCYVRARYYDPATAQFVSLDPMGWRGGTNPYAYCNNDPVQYRDPSGKFPPAIIAAVVASALISAGLDVISQLTMNDKADPYKWQQTALAALFGAITGGAGCAYQLGLRAVMILAASATFLQTMLVEVWVRGKEWGASLWKATIGAVFATIFSGVLKKWGENFGKWIGSKVGPLVNRLVTAVSEALDEVGNAILGGVVDIVQNTIRWAADVDAFITSVGQGIGNAIVSVAQGVASVVSTVAQGISGLIPDVNAISNGFWTTVGTIGNFIFGNGNTVGGTPNGTGGGAGWGGVRGGSGSGSQGGGSTPITLDPLQ